MTSEPPTLRLLVDEDFNRSIIRGLLARGPALDLVDVHAADLARTDDR